MLFDPAQKATHSYVSELLLLPFKNIRFPSQQDFQLPEEFQNETFLAEKPQGLERDEDTMAL